MVLLSLAKSSFLLNHIYAIRVEQMRRFLKPTYPSDDARVERLTKSIPQCYDCLEGGGGQKKPK